MKYLEGSCRRALLVLFGSRFRKQLIDDIILRSSTQINQIVEQSVLVAIKHSFTRIPREKNKKEEREKLKNKKSLT